MTKNTIFSFLQACEATVIKTAKKSWKGATIGALATFTLYLVIISLSYLKIGISPIADLSIALITVGILSSLIALLSTWGFKIIRLFNPWFVGICLSTYILVGFLPYPDTSRMFIGFELLCGALIGYSVYIGIKKKVSITLILIVLGLNTCVVYFLANEGSDHTTPVSENYWNQKAPTFNAPDPTIEGTYTVKTLTYGNGDDKNRDEYANSCDIKTSSVDATPFFDQTSGFDNWIREFFWGFDASNYPINGQVWYPEGQGPFPLVIFVHGNHLIQEYSDPGYEYIATLLASKGYIAASIDENFLNSNWSGDYSHNEIFTRAWLILKHLECWREWNQQEDNPFYQTVDMDNIALVGHSRGGQAAPLATVINKQKRYYKDAYQDFNFNFSIKGIAEIAPTAFYSMHKDKPLELENIDYLLLQGGYDQDVFSMAGSRKYNNLHFTDTNFHFKSVLYIYAANHGQFNTVWGRKDMPFPYSALLNLTPLMDGEGQRKIAQTYISAFLDASLKGKKENLSILKDYRLAKAIIPKGYYFNQYEDSGFKYIADYEEDLDVTTATLKDCSIHGQNLKTWKEEALILKDDESTSQLTSAVYLGWEKKDTNSLQQAEYTLQIDSAALASLDINTVKNLFFFIGNNSDTIDAVDFTLELTFGETSVKKDFSSFYVLPPLLKPELTKCSTLLSLGKEKVSEKVLQYVEIPLSSFNQGDSLSIDQLKEIRFIFNKKDKGEIILDRIGIN